MRCGAVCFQAVVERRYERLWRQKDIEDQAWESHHHQKETTVNMFAVVRRFAAVLTQVCARSPHP